MLTLYFFIQTEKEALYEMLYFIKIKTVNFSELPLMLRTRDASNDCI